MAEQLEKVKKEVEIFLKTNKQYLGVIIKDGSNVIVMGDIKRELLEILVDITSFIASTFKQLNVGSPRYFVAESDKGGVGYGKYGFDKVLIVYYRNTPLGTVMYDLKNLAQKLANLT
ncbi:MAG: hypothetical protein ABWK01_09250 [Infirmifilum sp.]